MTNHLPLEVGRHYVDSLGRRVIITELAPGQLMYADIIDPNSGKVEWETYYRDTGLSFTGMHKPRVNGFWEGSFENYQPVKAPDPICRCDIKALFSFGHEKSCEWANRNGEHRR